MLRGLLLLGNMTGVPRLVTRLMLDRRVPFRLKLILPAALLYLLSPIDIIHDMLPALGRIDDALVVVISVVSFLVMVPKEVVAIHSARARSRSSDKRRVQRSDKNVIDGSYRVIDDRD